MAQPARITTITDATGARYAVREDRPPPQTFGKGAWFIMFEAEALEIARSLNSASAWKVLVILPRHLDWSTWKPLRQQDLADELGLSNAAISIALAELVRLKLVLRKGKGTGIRWKLPAEWGFKGTPGQFHAVRGAQAAEGAVNHPPSNESRRRYSPETGDHASSPSPAPKKQRALRLLRPIDPPKVSDPSTPAA